MSTSRAGTDESTEGIGVLVHRLSEQIPELIRSEVRLAQAELAEKGKRAGIGLGMVSAAGVLGLFGLATLITTAVLALALVMPAWAAALVVTGVLFVVAAITAQVGRGRVREAAPPKPELAMESVRRDLAAIKGDDA